MPTYSQTKTQILDEIIPFGNSSILDTAVSRAIIAAQKYHEGLNKWWFTEDTTAITTSSGQSLYTLSSNIIQIYSLAYNEASAKYYPVYKPFKFIEEQRITNITGIPRYYSIFRERLDLYPTPGRSATVSISFHSKIPDPPGSASGSTTTRWLQEGLDLIKSRAKILVFENTIRDFEQGQTLRQQELEFIESLTTLNESRVMTGVTIKSL